VPVYRIQVEYDGRDFEGWQVQAVGSRTVQGCLEAALEQVTGERAGVTGSGRTDAGVHAEGQVASFQLAKEWAPDALQRALNGVLPRDVAVCDARLAEAGYDALRAIRRKRYRYRIWNARHRSPLRAARFAHVPRPLDLAAMRGAAAGLVGDHDFSSFRAAGSDARTSSRTLYRIEVRGDPGGEVEVLVEGSGFLRYMVRNIVGTLLEVGHGVRPADSMAELLVARDRAQAGPTAPAHGLTLELAWETGSERGGAGHSSGNPAP
jgi:tRNA pseudouridine38-40 synthase